MTNPPNDSSPAGRSPYQPGPPHGFSRPPHGPPPPDEVPWAGQIDPVPKRRRMGAKILAATAATVLALVLVFVVISAGKPRPDIGECLSSMEPSLFTGLDVVDCSDPNARYEVVEYTTSTTEPCYDHPDGESYSTRSGYRGQYTWAICAVPL